MVQISLFQFGSALVIGLFNLIFTVMRTRKKGAIITFPQPYFIVVERDQKLTVKGLIHNIGDRNTMVQLDTPLTRLEGKQDLPGHTIVAVDLNNNNNKPFHSQFPIAANQFYEIQATFEKFNEGIQNFYVAYRFVDNYGKWKTKIQEIEIGREQDNLTL